ncbi:MAG TPA: hypothetical protein VGK31_05370 [Thermoanaerobaculia bacterium]|jgi:endonuclease YncB( thermonuclease family)
MRLRLWFIFFVAVSVQAAPMYRVVRVIDATTIVVERDGVQSQVSLAGIEITDRQNAIAFLSWTLQSSWVMIENGQVYRSPDGMLINSELVKKGYARAAGIVSADHVSTVYLGELDLGVREKPQASASKQPARRARTARPSTIPRRPIRSRIIRAPLR